MVNKIHLSNFRNFSDRVFEFSDQITVIVGPNASGKTNILESVALLSTGKSFRATLQEEMINYDAELGRVKGKVNAGEEKILLEVMLTRGYIDRNGEKEKVQKKKLAVNGVARRMVDFAGKLKTVTFAPSDLDLVSGSPSLRRKFLDTLLSQVDYEYRRSLLSYEKGLRRRNRILLRIRDEGASRSQLAFWDRLLVKDGDYMSRRREEFVNYLNNRGKFNDLVYSVTYDKSAISEARLAQYSREEVYAGMTLVGPHRDDLIFRVEEQESRRVENFRDLDKFGSRGEQRMGVLWAKLGELDYICEKTGQKPVLLLDDIFSELDHRHRGVVMKAAAGQQSIITTADPHFVDKKKNIEVIKLE